MVPSKSGQFNCTKHGERIALELRADILQRSFCLRGRSEELRKLLTGVVGTVGAVFDLFLDPAGTFECGQLMVCGSAAAPDRAKPIPLQDPLQMQKRRRFRAPIGTVGCMHY